MTFDPKALERCAEWHEKMTALATAKSEEHRHAGELIDFEKQMSRAEGHSLYASSIRSALTLLKVRVKRGAFVPPTLQEALEYGREINFPKSEVEGWHDHFESNGWKVSGKTLMTDWKAALRNGKRMWQRNNPKAGVSNDPKHEDPEGWRKFLVANRLSYEPFKHASQVVKQRFQAQ
jgi:hypothetical protein